MKSIAHSPTITAKLECPPDGVYFGEWGGYIATFWDKYVRYQVHTEVGIRTPDVRCKITIENGEIAVETI